MYGTDNVATCLAEIAAGDEVALVNVEPGRKIVAREDIPYGHKIARAPIAPGALVRKYDQPIGRSTTAIEQGCHVHTHNVSSIRAKSEEAKSQEVGE
jgi:hypothetical protein